MARCSVEGTVVVSSVRHVIGADWVIRAQAEPLDCAAKHMLLDALSPNTDEGSREPRVVRNQPQACSFRKSDLVLVAGRSFTVKQWVQVLKAGESRSSSIAGSGFGRARPPRPSW